MTTQDRVLRARIAAHAKWAATPDRAAATAPARQAALDLFEKQVDPAGALDPAERAMRADHAKRAYFLSLALKSARSRAAGAASRKSAKERERLDLLALAAATVPTAPARSSCVYRYFDEAGTLLYVGKTVRGMQRAWEHAEHSLWWAEVAYSTVEHLPSDAQALAAEAHAILTESPLHNAQGVA